MGWEEAWKERAWDNRLPLRPHAVEESGRDFVGIKALGTKENPDPLFIEEF